VVKGGKFPNWRAPFAVMPTLIASALQ
jgi:hypothetical protein